MKISEGAPRESVGGIFWRPKFNMAAVGHIENLFFNGLAYSADQHMLSGVFWVKEFIFDIDFTI